MKRIWDMIKYIWFYIRTYKAYRKCWNNTIRSWMEDEKNMDIIEGKRA